MSRSCFISANSPANTNSAQTESTSRQRQIPQVEDSLSQDHPHFTCPRQSPRPWLILQTDQLVFGVQMTHSLGCITVQKRLTEPGRHFTTLNCFSQGHFVRGPKKQPWEELPSYLGRAWKGPKHTELLSLGIRVPTLQARDPLGAHHAGRCSSLRFYGGFIVHMCTSPTTGNQLDLQPLFPAQR